MTETSHPFGVPIVDAHHHLWDLDRNHYPWLAGDDTHEFFLGDFSALRRNYLPEDYRDDARGLGVVKTVHVEAEWNRRDQVGETRWVTEMNARSGMPDAIVGHAWFHREECERVLRAHSHYPLVRGIRSKPVTAASPDRMEKGLPGSMQDPRWLAGFEMLATFGFSWDLRVPYWHLHEAAEVAAAFPDTPIVLNHTGFPWDRTAAGLAAWRDAMRAIAACPNVWVKISELGLKDAPWEYESNREVVRDALEIFGVERAMFASNFPVAGLRVGYRELVESIMRMVEDLSLESRRALFHDNACTFYRI